MTGRVIRLLLLFVLIVSFPAIAQRNYSYQLTVGMSSDLPGFDESRNYPTINSAIDAMNSFSQPPLGPDSYGLIKIYPGTYIEQLNRRYSGCSNLPKYCDLAGMGDSAEDVVIQHWSQYDLGSFPVSIIYAGIYAEGDNHIKDLTIKNSRPEGENLGFVQNSLELNGAGVLDNCIIYSSHVALIAKSDLEITNSSLTSMYTYCIQIFDSKFKITDTVVNPRQYSSNFEYPTGIYAAYSSGEISNVSIFSQGTYRSSSYTPALTGISHLGSPSDYISVKDTDVSLSITTDKNDSWPAIPVCGIVEDGGTAYLDNCSVNITATETEQGNTTEDGKPLRVVGVLAKNRAIVHLSDCEINTTRNPAHNNPSGCEFVLENDSALPAFFIDDSTVFSSKGEVLSGSQLSYYQQGNMDMPAMITNSRTAKSYLTIQDAVDQAMDNDTIILSRGCYLESVSMPGRGIVLRSIEPESRAAAASTIINALEKPFAIDFSGFGMADSVSGLTLTNAFNAIICNSDLTFIADCIISGNKSNGVYVGTGSSALVSRCSISENSCGIFLVNSQGSVIANNTIYQNKYAVVSQNSPSSLIWNNTIVSNTLAGVFSFGSQPDIKNCIIWNNNDDLYGCQARYCCISTSDDMAGAGNISSDPGFLSTRDNNYRLVSGSPCIDAGDNSGVNYLGGLDYDGNLRLVDSAADIGAVESGRRVYNKRTKKSYIHIQDAIDQAVNGDIIEVAPGIYTQPLSIVNKYIHLASIDPLDEQVVANTIIDAGTGSGRCISLIACYQGDISISGFTIRNGTNAIYCNKSNPVIAHCVITGNSDSGIYSIGYSSATIRNCLINNNYYGVSLYRQEYTTIINNIITDNNTGIYSYCSYGTDSLIRNNTIVNNHDYGICSLDIPLDVSSCIIWGNRCDLSGIQARYSCISNPENLEGVGNISLDPSFIPGTMFELDSDSPCIDSGELVYTPGCNETDYFGSMRVSRGFADIGAYESFVPYYGGDGSIENPYLIYDKEGLLFLGSHVEDYDKCFKLMADISFAGDIFSNAIIAPSDGAKSYYSGIEFNGSFDGNGFYISDLNINSGELKNFIGLFGGIGPYSVLENISLFNIDIATEGSFAGSLCGINNAGLISNCFATDSRVDAIFFAGGLCGVNSGLLEDCYVRGVDVFGGKSYTGGLCGRNASSRVAGRRSAVIRNCWSSSGRVISCAVIGGLVGGNTDLSVIEGSYSSNMEIVSYNDTVGGFCGLNINSEITDCYSITNIQGQYNIGGFCAISFRSTISNCYSSGIYAGKLLEPFCNSRGATENNCFYDNSQNNTFTNNTANVTGVSYQELCSIDTFIQAGWDISSNDLSEKTWLIPSSTTPILNLQKNDNR